MTDTIALTAKELAAQKKANAAVINGMQKRINSLASGYKTIAEKAHILMCDLLSHYVEHEAPGLFTELMSKLEKSSIDRRAMAKWMKEYAALDYVKGKKGYHCKPARDDDGSTLYPSMESHALGCKTPFYAMDGNETVVAKPLDLLGDIVRKIASYEKRIEDESKGKVVDTLATAQLEGLKKYVADMVEATAKKKRETDTTTF